MSSCNGHFLSKSVADSGFIVASSELGDFAAINMLSPQADLAWRGDSSSDLLIQINLKESKLMDTLALCLHNMTSAATVTIELYDSRANPALLTVTETVGGDDTIPQYKNLILKFSETDAQEIDITISDADNSDNYVQVRRLKLGVLTVPVKGFDFGYTFGFVTGEEYRAGEISWTQNTEDELNSMNELIRDFGTDPDKYARTRAGELLGFPDDILWLGYPESTNDTTRNQHTALVALVGADIPYFTTPTEGAFTARFEEVYYEPVVERLTAFITTWRTTTTTETITLPATGTNSFYINWGDGDSEIITSASPSHEYAVAGDYVVTIEGSCSKWYQNDTGVSKNKIVEISQWGDVGFTELNSAFYGCANMYVTAKDKLDTSSITDLSHMFDDCSTIYSLYMDNWDVGSCTDFSYMLSHCSGISTISLLNWDVSSGTDFSLMFESCSNISTLEIGAWDVGSGLDFSSMFQYCALIIDFSVASWDIGAATDMTLMFDTSGLTDSEYDEILVSWESQSHQSSVTFNAGSAQYSAGAPATARAALVSDSWTISDGGAA